MKTVIFLSAFCSGGLSGPIELVAGDSGAVQVRVTRALNLGAVRTLDASAPWAVLQQSFVSSYSKSLAGSDGKSMPVRLVGCDGSAAADKLRDGECDAVFVVGDQLPYSLKSAKFTVTRAVSQIGSPVYVFYLVTRAGDSVAATTLIPAFEQATASAGFQESVGRASAVRVVAHDR